jgi:hypothetical protein
MDVRQRGLIVLSLNSKFLLGLGVYTEYQLLYTLKHFSACEFSILVLLMGLLAPELIVTAMMYA